MTRQLQSMTFLAYQSFCHKLLQNYGHSMQVMHVAAVGCRSMGELMAKLQMRMTPDSPTLLHAAVRSGSISTTNLLLDLHKAPIRSGRVSHLPILLKILQ